MPKPRRQPNRETNIPKKRKLFAALLLIFGFILMFSGLVYTLNSNHAQVFSSKTYFINGLSANLDVKYKTEDVFMAGNPMDVSIHTDLSRDGFVTVTFEGAETTFSGDFHAATPWGGPPVVAPIGPDDIKLNQVRLTKNGFIRGGPYEYRGDMSDLTYSMGGNFDIRVEFAPKESSGLQAEDATEYLIPNAVVISPADTISISHSNRLMIGLAWIAVGAAFFVPVLIVFLADAPSTK